MAQTLRHKIPYEEFDYQALLSALKEYKRPRDRITRLLRQGTIVRVKKGLYVFGENDRRSPANLGILANLMHGPSYVSLEYALWRHGLIPERVEAVTSVVLDRSREFETPLGRFTYRRIPLAAFRAGVELVDAGQGRHFLMAGPEKALADKVFADRIPQPSIRGIRAYLVEDLRVDPEALREMNPELVKDYADRFDSRKVRFLARALDRMRRTRGGREGA